jgi:hypothetical protein
MSTLDARIMQFMSRKEVQFPELKQPSVVIYRNLRNESHSSDIDTDPKTFKKAVGSPLSRALFTA